MSNTHPYSSSTWILCPTTTLIRSNFSYTFWGVIIDILWYFDSDLSRFNRSIMNDNEYTPEKLISTYLNELKRRPQARGQKAVSRMSTTTPMPQNFDHQPFSNNSSELVLGCAAKQLRKKTLWSLVITKRQRNSEIGIHNQADHFELWATHYTIRSVSVETFREQRFQTCAAVTTKKC